MSNRWLVRIEIWPFFVEGETKDQASAGPRENDFVVRANDLEDAMKKADLIAMGIRTNPRVWRAPIVFIIHDAQWKQLTKKEVTHVNDAKIQPDN